MRHELSFEPGGAKNSSLQFARNVPQTNIYHPVMFSLELAGDPIVQPATAIEATHWRIVNCSDLRGSMLKTEAAHCEQNLARGCAYAIWLDARIADCESGRFPNERRPKFDFWKH